MSYLLLLLGILFLGLAFYQRYNNKIIVKYAGWIALVLLLLSGVINSNSNISKVNQQSIEPDHVYKDNVKIDVMLLINKNKKDINSLLGEPIGNPVIEKDGRVIIAGYKYSGDIEVAFKDNKSFLVNIKFPYGYDDYKEILRAVKLPDDINPTNQYGGIYDKTTRTVNWDSSINGIKRVMIWGENMAGSIKYKGIQIDLR
jgi:hypothetical protein